jgi:DNA invertase Pin-like site-specific DNA recombinase
VHPRRLLIELAKSMFGKGRVGDTLVAWRLDRLGRSLKENIDTTPSRGKLVFQIFGALLNLSRRLSESEHKQGFMRLEVGER